MVVRFALTFVLFLAFTSTPFAQSSSKPLRAAGRVEAVTQDSVTILVGAEKMTLAVDNATKITGKGLDGNAKPSKGDGNASAITDLVKTSDSVVVKYVDAGGGKLRATEINVRLISKP
jgi:hypothetical protein